MSRRAVVFGAAGQLGIELVRELQKRRFAVMAWDRSQVDITDAAAVQKALADFDAEVVFNCAAYKPKQRSRMPSSAIYCLLIIVR